MEGGFGLAFNSVLQVARLRLPSNDKSFCFPLPRARINTELKELRVCTNRTCRRQGSMQILETLSSLAPPEVAVKSCGCLGRCGAGPNLVALPDGVVVGHCGTPARASEILMVLCGIKSDHDAAKNLEALALRKRAEAEFEKANFSEADRFLSQLRLTHAYVYPNHGKINLAKAASSLQRLIEVLLSLISVLLLSSKPYPVHELVGVNEERPAIPVSNNVGCSSYLKHVKECSKNKAEHDHFGILYTQLQFLMFNNNPFGQHKESCLPS